MFRVRSTACLLLDQALFGRATRDDEIIVVAITSPRARRDIVRIDKLPIRYVGRLKSEVITHCRRNIEPCAVVQVRFRPLVAEDVLKVIGAERTAIFPLRVTGAVTFANRDPAMPANRLSLAHVITFKPWNDERRLRFELSVRHVVVRQRAVKRILLRNEIHWDVITPR